jgi:hypothetical protein
VIDDDLGRPDTPDEMMRALLDAHDGDIEAATVDWNSLKAETDAQLERELEGARTWQPKINIRPLLPAEHDELDGLLAGRLANKPTVGTVKRRRDDAGKGPEYAARAIEGEAVAVASAPVGLRAKTLNASAWTLARPELEGIVDADDIETALVPAAIDAGLSEREARSIVRGALCRRGRR